ncbi:MAG: hypothetical protein JSU97_09860 [Dehalococcoidia bacterium]|nr:MAG: hypothetical protein JSU97_09860 [Dehalococcoidia bacterium]
MRSMIAKLVLLLLAVVLVPGLLALTRAIEQGLPEAQERTMHNYAQVDKWATSV